MPKKNGLIQDLISLVVHKHPPSHRKNLSSRQYPLHLQRASSIHRPEFLKVKHQRSTKDRFLKLQIKNDHGLGPTSSKNRHLEVHPMKRIRSCSLALGHTKLDHMVGFGTAKKQSQMKKHQAVFWIPATSNDGKYHEGLSMGPRKIKGLVESLHLIDGCLQVLTGKNKACFFFKKTLFDI